MKKIWFFLFLYWSGTVSFWQLTIRTPTRDSTPNSRTQPICQLRICALTHGLTRDLRARSVNPIKLLTHLTFHFSCVLNSKKIPKNFFLEKIKKKRKKKKEDVQNFVLGDPCICSLNLVNFGYDLRAHDFNQPLHFPTILLYLIQFIHGMHYNHPKKN